MWLWESQYNRSHPILFKFFLLKIFRIFLWKWLDLFKSLLKFRDFSQILGTQGCLNLGSHNFHFELIFSNIYLHKFRQPCYEGSKRCTYNMPCLNLGNCWVPTFRHLHHDANMHAFINESLDNVLPKFRHHAKYLQVYTWLFCTLLKILSKIFGTVQKIKCWIVKIYSSKILINKLYDVGVLFILLVFRCIS